MDDQDILQRITTLVDEEHRLREEAPRLEEDHPAHERLRALEVNLDQCWDLLRQRRALRHAGQSPDDARVREARTVEKYQQ